MANVLLGVPVAMKRIHDHGSFFFLSFEIVYSVKGKERERQRQKDTQGETESKKER